MQTNTPSFTIILMMFTESVGEDIAMTGFG